MHVDLSRASRESTKQGDTAMRLLKETMGFVAFSILMSSGAIAHAGDACKNVKFKYTNKHNSGGIIEVRQVKYFNKANGAWQTEDVSHFDCAQGKTCTTTGDNLADSEGEDLTKIRFIYRYKGPKSTDNWSDDVEGGDKIPDDPTCVANRVYGPGDKGFTIFGTE
jgi:hypothetical protein